MKDITLRPWAKVEGTVTIDGKPAAKQRICLQYASLFRQGPIPISVEELQARRISLTFDVFTDAQGHFAWDRVFPGEATISRRLSQRKTESYWSWPEANRRSVALYPGRTLAVTIRDSGLPILQEREDP